MADPVTGMSTEVVYFYTPFVPPLFAYLDYANICILNRYI